MTREEILKSNYMKLDGACEDDWQEGSKDEMHRCILASMFDYAQQEVAAALSTQSPKWVKASERLWEYGQKVIVRYGNEVHYTQYHNITYCVPVESIEWLDESPSSTHPLQEKIDGLREALAMIKNMTYNSTVQTWVTKALETYK